MGILISGDFTHGQKALFRQLLEEEVYFDDQELPQSAGAHIRVALMTSWKRLSMMLPQLPNLEMVQCFFAGADRITFEDVPADIVIATASGAMASSIAEHAFSLLLSLSRNLFMHDRKLRKGDFSQLSPLNTELRGKSIGIIGYGSIGREVGRRARSFGMKVLAINTSGESDADKTFTLEGMDELLRSSDFVIVCIPLNAMTKGAIDTRRLKVMKDSAILVNVSRGKVIDEGDLYRHLKENPGFRAGLDVWWHYPKEGEKWSQEYPFDKLDNVAMTPHNAAMIPGWEERTIEFCSKNIMNYLNGRKIENKVRKEDYLI
ncbi:MAG: hydroxyacid dehydrogenase [Candidatus Methanofastidiosa archaeon]|nr:hydroxyacid dehydrogenase [Candidatus Methanofastidiosa archaeon]